MNGRLTQPGRSAGSGRSDARSVRLDAEDPGARVLARQVHDGEGADVEMGGILDVRAEGASGRERDLVQDLWQYRAVTADHGGLAGADALADAGPDIRDTLLEGVLAEQLINPQTWYYTTWTFHSC